MRNDQQEPTFKAPSGIKKKSLSDKPKEKRILEMITPIIARIQNDERNYRPTRHTNIPPGLIMTSGCI